MNEVGKFFADAFRHMGGNRGVPAIEVRFYPYAGLRHTIRLRSGGSLSRACSESECRPFMTGFIETIHSRRQ